MIDVLSSPNKRRALLQMAMIWGGVWSVVAFCLYLPEAREPIYHTGPLAGEAPTMLFAAATVGAMLGALSGIVFAAVVAFRERARAFGQLSTPRMLAWGFLAGVMPLASLQLILRVPPSNLGHLATVYAGAGILGACCAGASHLLARRDAAWRSESAGIERNAPAT